jgi:hypothetical protein
MLRLKAPISGSRRSVYKLHDIGLTVSLLVLLVLPGVLGKFPSVSSSLKEGLFIASLVAVWFYLLFGFGFQKSYLIKILVFFALALIFLFLHGITKFHYEDFDHNRFTGSVVLLISLVILWIPISQWVLVVKSDSLHRALKFCFGVLLLDGIISLILFRFGFGKSMLTASEPAIFSWSFAPLIFYLTFKSRSSKFIWITFVLAVGLENLTLLLSAILIFVFYFRLKLGSAVFLCFLLTLLFTISSEFKDYVFDRVNLVPDSDNLSALVFISGYERAYQVLSFGYLTGVGFNQLGFVGPLGNVMSDIVGLTGKMSNLTDGGTLAAKLIAELGLFGLAALLLYLLGFVKLYLTSKADFLSDQKLFFAAFYVLFFIFLFVRGSGYFNAPFFFFVFSLLPLFYSEKKVVNR